MKFIKKKKNKTKEYLLQDTETTKIGIGLIAAVLVILVSGVILSGYALQVF